MPPKSAPSGSKGGGGGNRRPGKLSLRTAWTDADSAQELNRYTGNDASKIPVLPELAFLSDQLGANLGFFMANVGQFIARYTLQLQSLEAPDGPLDNAMAALKLHPIHPVGRVIRLKVDHDDDEEVATADVAEVTTADAAETAVGGEDAAAADGVDDDDDDSDAESDAPEPSPDAPPVFIPDNTVLLTQLRSLKKEAYELGTTLEGIRDWIAINIPMLDAGIADQVGLTVMTGVMEAATEQSGAVRGVYDLEMGYLEARAEVEITMERYPDSATRSREMIALEVTTWDGVRDGWRQLNRSAILTYEKVRKNFSRLRTPLQQSEITAGGLYV